MEHCKVIRKTFQSEVLEGNRLGDPSAREVPVIVPPGYEEGSASYPVIFVLAGFMGSGHNHLNWDIFAERLDQRVERLVHDGELPPAILVLPDCSTRIGGSQYRNSEAVGNYADYITEELVPWVDETFRTIPGRRAVVGKSSGGYGALMLGMERPDLFPAVASHSGDAYFEYCYKRDFPMAVDRLAKEGGIEPFLAGLWSKPKKTGSDIHVLNIVAMAACYSPDASEPWGVALPFHLPTGELRNEVWERWLEQDPAERIPSFEDNLRKLETLYLDCGFKDEYYLHLGMRILSGRLKERGISHQVEEFEDDHRSISYRMDVSLPLLAKSLL